MSLAAHIDEYRAIPRLLMAVYMLLLWEVTQWFMGLPAPNTAQGALIATVWGAGAAWFKVYVDGKPTVHSPVVNP